MQKKTKILAFRITLAAFAFATIFTAVRAFVLPSNDPNAIGFASPCAFALSKDDDCSFTQDSHSLEAIADTLATKTTN